jgi:protein-disulfide isomerase
VRSKLVKSKKEGVRNRVESTPALFINGRRYVGDLDVRSVLDVLMEEYDRVTGNETK